MRIITVRRLWLHDRTFMAVRMSLTAPARVTGSFVGPDGAIVPGQAAFWQIGEWHESGTETGLSAVVVESESLDPSVYMQEV